MLTTTTTMVQYLLIVLLVSCLNSQSANSQKISAKLNTNDKNDGPRKLKDNIEIITHSNMIVEDSSSNSKKAKPKNDIYGMVMDENDTKEYQYFNDASEVSTPKYAKDLSPNYDLSKYKSPKYESLQYEPPANLESTNVELSNIELPNIEPPQYGPPLPPLLPSIKIPSNFKIDEADLTHSYYSQQFEPMPYAPNDPLLDDGPIHVPVSVPVPVTSHDLLPIAPATSLSLKPIHSGPSHIVKVTHKPIWAPEVAKLESQYLEAYRSIKSSVLSFYYKMHYFVNYFMNLFSFAGESSNINSLLSLLNIGAVSKAQKQIDLIRWVSMSKQNAV